MADILSPPLTTTLQTLLILQRYDWHRADHISAWYILGLAVSLDPGQQLHLELSDEAGTATTMRETRRRLLWSCFVMDSMIDGGRKPLIGLDVSAIEFAFHATSECSTWACRPTCRTRYMPSASHDPVVTICLSLALRVLVIER